jgi:hypothetical protein
MLAAASLLAKAELSGLQWVDRFPGSRSTEDLRQPFQGQVEQFLRSLANAGAAVTIHSTYRPSERQYLMHWAWRIARERHLQGEGTVPALAGVDIQWHWRDGQGRRLRGASTEAANQMVNGYGLRFRPALISRHAQRRAIDMSITWEDTLHLVDHRGLPRPIANLPRDGHNPVLHAVGGTHGVFKLVTDCPHWSDDGH